jgi:hypothetical protein
MLRAGHHALLSQQNSTQSTVIDTIKAERRDKLNVNGIAINGDDELRKSAAPEHIVHQANEDQTHSFMMF